MDFRGDERGAVVQVAAIVLLGFVVVSFSLYQAQVVPTENEETELEHSKQVKQQFQALATNVHRTARMGASQPTSVMLGTRYDPRVAFVNPPPPSGRLRTEQFDGSTNVTIENAVAVRGETADYWNESRTFRTRALVYRPSYNRYRNAPSQTVEHGIAYSAFDSGRTLVTDRQRLVQGDRLFVTTLNGSLSRTGTDSASVDPRPTSVSETTVRLRNGSGGGKVTLVVPTRLSESTWESLLSAQRASNGGNVTGVTVSGGQLRVTLLDGTYRLRMAKIGIGDAVAPEPAHYVTNVGARDRVLAPGERTRLFVEVRDRYNNPVSGVPVNWTEAGFVVDRTRTGTDGRAAIDYASSTSGTVDLVASIGVAPGDATSAAPRKRVEYELRVGTAGTGLVWDVPGDWDAATESRSVVHESFGDHIAGRVDPGYANDRTGLVAYYPLDRDTDGPALEAARGGPTLSKGGTTVGDGGVLDTTAFMLGANYASNTTTAAADMLNGLTDFTLSVWVKPTAADVGSNHGIVGGAVPDGEDNVFSLRYDSSGFFGDGTDLIKAAISFDGNGNGREDGPGEQIQIESSSNVQTTDWQHIAVAREDGGPLRLYVDGRRDDERYLGDGDGNSRPRSGFGGQTGPVVGATEFAVGRSAQSGGEWDGHIDEVRLYNESLSAAEVRRLYNGTAPTEGDAWRGTLTTDGKAFASGVSAGSLRLTGVNATLPTGTNVAVTVESDPDDDGAFEEVGDPIVLNGSATYDVTGLTTDSARYRLRIELNTTDVASAPSVDGIELETSEDV